MNNSYIIVAYLIYLPIALVLTWIVADNLFKSGLIFMRDIFFGREDIAKATNSLFKVGFYLLNIGFALFILKIYNSLTGMQDTIEVLSSKVGGFSIYLGVMLFFNLYLFFRGKRVAKQRHSASTNSNQVAPQ
jgi:predicted PurR-regulated permease PerM